MKETYRDEHFANFADSLERLLTGYDLPDRKGLNEHQRSQVEGLVAAEKDFMKAVARHSLGEAIYRDFIKFIREERRNILAARPYFRERDDSFKEFISPALQISDWRRLQDFSVNAVFIQLMLERFAARLKPGSPIKKTAAKVFVIRSAIIEQNLPLAINRARIFRSKTPSSPHMDFMDFVQVSVEGLISAVDKFVLPYRPQFRAVIIGRSTGNLISNYSEPMLHFFPGDRRKLYQANKARGRYSELDSITEAVNTQLPVELQTTKEEIQMLLNASSHLSLDQTVNTGADESTYLDFTTDTGARPDEIVERADLGNKLLRYISELSLFERKALVLKGICSEENLYS